ncbi:Sas10/Utp3/C1D family-domain-containing protein [Crassisporium funariophilum]|nr:Sas10/Utp3/C1D family-domain-containing protein [Crassisporium funariophilum]
MTAETSKIKAKLAALTSSFDDLEAQLEPLFSQTLPETIVGLEPIQQAKLQTVLPYLVYDLIFIYLKTKGIDPKTHPVVPELDRIRQYFEKISNAEKPPAKRTEIDKAAASRFIKHAITQAQSQWKKTAAEEASSDEASTSAPKTVRAQLKVTSKMLQRAAYEKQVKEQDAMESEEEGLEVFGGDGAAEGGEAEERDGHGKMEVDSAGRKEEKDKGKEVAQPIESLQSRNKRRRPVVDPFTGYGDVTTSSSYSTSKKPKSSSNSPQPQPSSDIPQETSTPASTSPIIQGTPTNPAPQNSKLAKKAKSKTKKSKPSTK